ncbi:antifreeze protein [Paraburkholderia aspalathi]|nr:antifreeze protein [Paraburkholderia aspalathi]
MFAISMKSIVVSAAIGLASVMSVGASANAASVASTPAIHTGSHQTMTTVDYRNNRNNRHHKNYRGPACSAKQATMKASRMGIHKARVTVNRNRIVVRGVKHGRPASVAFAAQKGCPVLR